MFRLFSILAMLLLSGCGTTPMNYESKTMPIEEAYDVIDQMVMTQHRKWKPDYFVITDKYLGWGYGAVSNGSSSGVVYNNVALGSSSSTIRNVSDRVYFSKVKGVQLLDWTRKFKQWYVVSLIGQNGNVIKHLLRTRSVSDAQLMMDAMTVLLNDRSVTG